MRIAKRIKTIVVHCVPASYMFLYFFYSDKLSKTNGSHVIENDTETVGLWMTYDGGQIVLIGGLELRETIQIIEKKTQEIYLKNSIKTRAFVSFYFFLCGHFKIFA